MLQDPEMKKVLQEREQRYLENIAWLDGDLNRRIQEEEEKQRVYEENIAWLDSDLNEKLDQRHQENVAWLDSDLNEKAGSETPGERRLVGQRLGGEGQRTRRLGDIGRDLQFR